MVLNPWMPERDPIRLALLGKLGEELGECSSAALRCIIQGIDEREPVTGKLNREWLEDEIADVLAGCQIVKHDLSLNLSRISERAIRKLEHLRGWHELIRKGQA